MIWTDPILKPPVIPDELQAKYFQLGDAKFQLLPSQYGFLDAKEEFLGYIGGYGSGKTRIGSIKAAYLSVFHPGNRGLVGMEAGTDLEETAERDLLDFLQEAGLLKKAPTTKDRTAYVHCIDARGKALGYESEVQFVHLDDPKHVRGRHLGWFWIDEGSKVKREAWQNLIGRLRLPSFKGKYQAYVTGNPEGHNWIYDFFFNRELIETITCGGTAPLHAKTCPDRDDAKCNRRLRRKRRAFHCTSYENYFLPEDYIANMVASFSEEERRRYIEASFEVFEGQVFKEWSEDLHVLSEVA